MCISGKSPTSCHSFCSCRSFNACGGKATTLALLFVLGVESRYSPSRRQRLYFTVTVAFFRSASFQCMAVSSPTRSPVQSSSIGGYIEIHAIQMEWKQLEALGFHIGDTIQASYEEGSIHISLAPQTPSEPAIEAMFFVSVFARYGPVPEPRPVFEYPRQTALTSGNTSILSAFL